MRLGVILSMAATSAVCMSEAPAWAQNTAQYTPEEYTVFEDGALDMDSNDIAVRHASRCEFGPTGDLSKQRVHLSAVADGGTWTNGLAIEPPAATTSASDSFGSLPTDGAGRYVLWTDFQDAFPGASGPFVNTTAAAPVLGQVKVVEMHFAPGYAPAVCPPPRFVLIRPSEGLAIDTTTALPPPSNRPLAYRLPAGFDVPGETIDIAETYTRLTSWLDSVVTGCTPGLDCAEEDWYTTPATGKAIDRPDLREPANALPPLPSCSDTSQNGDEEGLDCGGTVCPACVEPHTMIACDGSAIDVAGKVVVTFGANLEEFLGGHDGTDLLLDLPEDVAGWYAYDPTVPDGNPSALAEYAFGSGEFYVSLTHRPTEVPGGRPAGTPTCRIGSGLTISYRDGDPNLGEYDAYEVNTYGPGWSAKIVLQDTVGQSNPGTALGTLPPRHEAFDTRQFQMLVGGYDGDWGFAYDVPEFAPRLWCDTCPRAFVTSGTFDGALGGLDGADAICQDAALLGGTWRAWLGIDGGPGPAQRFALSAEPYVRLDGVAIARDWADLADNALGAPLNVDETGATVVGYPTSGWVAAWSNVSLGEASAVYAPEPYDCSDWTSSTAGRARSGMPSTATQLWTASGRTQCSSPLHLYCFEQ